MKVFVVMRLCVVGLISIRTISIYIHSLELPSLILPRRRQPRLLCNSQKENSHSHRFSLLGVVSHIGTVMRFSVKRLVHSSRYP
jgi:hypothetical protein